MHTVHMVLCIYIDTYTFTCTWVGDGQGSLACCSPWGRKESDTTEWLNWTDTYLYTHMCVSCFSSVQFFTTLWTVAARLLRPRDSPSKNTGMDCYALLQGIFPIQGRNRCLLHRKQTLYCWAAGEALYVHGMVLSAWNNQKRDSQRLRAGQ